MFKRLLLIFSIFLSSSQFCQCQNKKIDSALNVFHSMQIIDTAKLELLAKIIYTIAQTDVDKALQYCDTLHELATKKFGIELIVGSYLVKSNILRDAEMYNEDIINNEKALKVIERLGNKKALSLRANLYARIGYSSTSLSNFDKALDYYLKSLEIGYKIKDSVTIMKCTMNITGIYGSIEDWTSSIKYSRKTIELTYNKKYCENMYILSYSSIGKAFRGLKKYTESLSAYKRSIFLCDSFHVPLSDKIYVQSMGVEILYRELKDYENSYHTSMDICNFYKDNEPYYWSYLNLSLLFLECSDSQLKKWNIPIDKRIDTAEAIMMQVKNYNDKSDAKNFSQEIMKSLSILNEKKGDYNKAYNYYKNFKDLEDSIGYSSLRARILVKDMEFNFDRKSDSLKIVQTIVASNLRQQISKQQQQTILATKEKELQHLAFLKTQADLQNTSLKNSQNEKELSLTKKEKDLQTAQVSKLAKDKELSTYKLNQQKFIGLTSIVVLSLLTFFIIYNNRLRRKRIIADFEKDKANQLLNEAELKNKMNDITMMALRSQMNPHFIFNCLNSIMLYTVENKTEEAAEYINRFAKLIRNMLESSRNDRVVLNSELESIKLYIELEAMRFKNKLNYSIRVDENIDQDFTEIPPLLIQPYIENAIWHGLMPKASGGNLNIHIYEEGDNLLVIKITDNGIGRVAAEAIKSRKETYHKSLGTNITGERIALINEKFKSNATVSIIDLYDNNQAAGTQVIIKLPLE